jgi:hypothetical protein
MAILNLFISPVNIIECGNDLNRARQSSSFGTMYDDLVT